MDGDQKTIVSITFIIVVGIVGIVVALSDYFYKKNDQIANAKTCEAAVIINGGNQVDQKLLLCVIGNKKLDVAQ